MCILRFQKPNAAFKAECFIRQRAHRAYIDDISDEIVFQCFVYVGRNLGMLTAVKDSVLAFVGELIGCKHAAVAKYAAGHVQLNIRTDIVLFECAAVEFETCAFLSVFIAQILKLTFACLVTDRAIERVIDQ